MMLMTVTDIALRRLANRPLSFSYELTTMFLAVVAILLIAYTCSQRRQVSIDLFVSRLPLKLQNIFLAIGDLAGFILFGLVAWRSVIYALHTKDIGYVTGILRLPLYPFIFVVAFGAASACLSTLIKFLDHFKNEAQE